MEYVNAVKPRQHKFVKIVLKGDRAMWLGSAVLLRMVIVVVAMGAEL